MEVQIHQLSELEGMGLSFLRNPQIVNSKLAEKMKEKKIGDKDLAKLTGTTRQAIYYNLNKNGVTSIENALKWAHVLDCKVEDLFSLADDAWYETAKDDEGRTIYFDHLSFLIKSGNDMKKIDKKVRLEQETYSEITEKEYNAKLIEKINEAVNELYERNPKSSYTRDEVAEVKAKVKKEHEELYPKRYEVLYSKIYPIVLGD